MPIVSQVLTCPVCGAGRKLHEIGLDGNGAFDEANTPAYTPAVKLQEMGGGKNHIVWTAHEMPKHVLQAIRQRLVAVLAQVDRRLGN